MAYIVRGIRTVVIVYGVTQGAMAAFTTPKVSYGLYHGVALTGDGTVWVKKGEQP